MSAIGPELPLHLVAKRKRKQEEKPENETTTISGASRSPSSGDGEKRRRVMGPAMPPASLEERPEVPAKGLEESDSDDDDGFGPALPPDASNDTQTDKANGDVNENATRPESARPEEKPRRDEWMTMPPKQDDLASRMDPSKQRPRAFNTSKGARGPQSLADDSSSWHETIEEKQKRLADEMMGVSKASNIGPQRPDTVRDEGAGQKIRERTEKTRGPSLLDKHQQRTDTEPEDDPSKRAFDREKDMSSGTRIGHAQRREMLDKASGFSSKFSGGSYL